MLTTLDYEKSIKTIRENLTLLHKITMRDNQNNFALIDDMAGFSSAHANIGKSLVEAEIWTKKDIQKAHELNIIYKRQVDISNIGDIKELLQHVPSDLDKDVRRIVTIDKTVGNTIVFQFDYDMPLINRLKNDVTGRYYDVMTKTWRVRDLNIDKVNSIKEFYKNNDFLITPSAQYLLDSIIQDDVISNTSEKVKRPIGKVELIDFYEQGKAIFITFEFSHEILNKIHDIQVIRLFRTINSSKGWVFRLSDIEQAEGDFHQDNFNTFIKKVRKISEEHNITITPEVEQLFQEKYDVNIVDTKLDKVIELDPNLLLRTLRPFQETGVKYILERKNVLLGDNIGVGKTIQAIASIINSKVAKALIIVPNTLKYNWMKEWKETSDNHFVTMIKANSKEHKIDWNADIIIINYDLVDKWYKQLSKIKFEFIILDESHYIKNIKTKRTQNIIKLFDEINPEYRLLMSGTAVTNRPKELIPQLKCLGVFRKFASKDIFFLKRYCGAVKTSFGLNSDGATNLDELYNKLIQICYLRRETKDVLKDLPEKQRNICYIDIDNRKEYDLAEYDLLNYLAEWKQYDKKQLGKVERAEHLVKIEHLKQILAKGKLNQSIQWTKDFLETGEKLVLFIHHKEIAEELLKEFPEALSILSSTSIDDRNKAVWEFQNNPDKKLIICSIKCASVGLTLTASSNLAFLELLWTPADHEQAEGRIYRISQVNNCNFYYILGKDTIEETDIYPLIESKREVCNAITRGMAEDDMETNIMPDLLNKWCNRKNL